MSAPAANAAAAGAAWRRWRWLVPPFAVGAFLRLFRLGPQLLVYDELHAPRTVIGHDLRAILTTYLPSDNSIPLTALFEVLVGWGVEVSELHLRLPSILAGLAALAVVPVAVARRLGTPTARWAAWLVAISPGLVLYSRIARSYMPVALLAFLAVAAFESWWRSGRKRAAAVYVVCGGLAVWLHLLAAPFVAAPLAWAGGMKLARRREGRSWGEMAAVGAGLAAALAAFLLPAWASFAALLAGKSGSPLPAWRVPPHVLMLQAGAVRPWAAVLFWGLAAVGLWALFTRRRGFALLTVAAPAANLGALLAVSPLGLASPMIFNRYLLVGLPLTLVWVAAGLERVAAASVGWRRAAALAVPLLVLGGPFLDARLLTSSYLAHDDFVDFAAARTRPVTPDALSDFYRRLGRTPGDEAIVELPCLPTWTWQTHLRVAQDVHRRRVLLSPAEKGLFGAGFRFRNFVAPNPRAFLAAPARWLVLHRKSGWELDRVDVGTHVGLPLGDRAREDSRTIARRMGGYLRRLWGPPDFADATLLVWDLDRVRRERAGSAAAAGGEEAGAPP